MSSFAISLLALLGAISSPQSNGGNARSASHALPRVSTIKAFDTSVEVLPSHFGGINVQELWRILSEREAVLAKDEYETKQQNQTRRNALGDQISSKFRISDTVAIVLPLEFGDYDSENEELPFYIPYELSPGDTGGLFTWRWNQHYVATSAYVASNAFGASVKVEKGSATQYSVLAALPDWLDLLSYSSIDTPSFRSPDLRQIKIALAPADAKRAKVMFEAVLIGNLASPLVDETVRDHQPTLDANFDTHEVFRNVYMNAKEFWVVDKSSGHIVQRFNANTVPKSMCKSPCIPSLGILDHFLPAVSPQH